MRATRPIPAPRAVIALAALLATATPGAAQDPEIASVKGSGGVRVCDADGDNVDSDGDQYGLTGAHYLAGPPPGFDNFAYACRGRPQTFDVHTTADPDGDDRFGFRMVSQVSIAVDFEPQFTDVYGESAINQQVCFVGPGTAPNNPRPPKITVVARARGARSVPQKNCLDDNGAGPTEGPCSSSRARFGDLGTSGFVDRNGRVVLPHTFIDLTDPQYRDQDGWIRLTKVGKMLRGLGETFLLGGLSGTLMTSVAGTPSGSASGDVRFWLEADRNTIDMVACEPTFPFSVGSGAAARVILPKPVWWIDEGDAIPDDFTLAISPPTGPITFRQAFDLSVMAATGGAAVTGISGTIDGQNVSGPLAACLRPTAALGGVQGTIFTCRGLSGGFLAGIFGTGAHTLSITMSLSDGRTITNDATWTIRR